MTVTSGYVLHPYMEDAPHSVAYIEPIAFAMMPPLTVRSRVLDVGCGNGAMLAALRQRVCCSVVGIDPSPSGIAVARRLCPEGRFEVGEAHEQTLTALGEGGFDVVLCTEVIEHVYDPRGLARACYQALKLGGRLIISTPFNGFWKSLAIAVTNHFDAYHSPLWDGGHIKFWSRASLSQLLSETGFRDIHFRGAGRFPPVWMSMVLSGTRREQAPLG